MKPYMMEFVADSRGELDKFVSAYIEVVMREFEGARIYKNEPREVEYTDRYFWAQFVFTEGVNPEDCEAAQHFAWESINPGF